MSNFLKKLRDKDPLSLATAYRLCIISLGKFLYLAFFSFSRNALLSIPNPESCQFNPLDVDM